MQILHELNLPVPEFSLNGHTIFTGLEFILPGGFRNSRTSIVRPFDGLLYVDWIWLEYTL